MQSGNDIKLYNDGNFYRDILHVEDAIDGIKFIIENGNSEEIYNLGSGSEPILFKDVIEYLHDQIKSTSKIGNMEPTDFHKIVQVESMYMDTNKITKLGFKPKMTVLQSVYELI